MEHPGGVNVLGEGLGFVPGGRGMGTSKVRIISSAGSCVVFLLPVTLPGRCPWKAGRGLQSCRGFR